MYEILNAIITTISSVEAKFSDSNSDSDSDYTNTYSLEPQE